MNELSQLQKELTKKGYNIKFANEITEEKKLKTGIFALDYVLDGGIAQCEGGHRILYFGAEGSSKTTFCLHIIKKYQELKKKCVFVDAENSYDKNYAELIGVDNKNLIIIKPKSLEEFGDMISNLISQTDLIVIDSIVSLMPEDEGERETNEPTMALQARINSLITRKMYSALSNSTSTLIFINQLREKVGGYGNPFTFSGGHAIKHFVNTILEFKLGKPIEKGEGDEKEKIGINVDIRCTKNKRGKNYRQAIVSVYFDGTIGNKDSLFYAGVKYNLIERNGNTYIYKEHKKVGKEKFIEEFDKWEELEKDIWQIIEKKKEK